MLKDYIIAGLRVRMDTFGRAERQALPYLCDFEGEPDIIIDGDSEKLRQTQPHLSLDSCEYLTTGSSFYRQLIRHGGLLLHSSAVIADGIAYLFSAPCGTGKSTHTALWCEYLGAERAFILNDDKPALRREDGIWYAYGTPWSGKSELNINTRAPIGGICLLSRGENKIEPASGSKTVFRLLEQTARPRLGSDRALILEHISALLEQLPVWHMHCTPDRAAAQMAYAAMSRGAARLFNNQITGE